jgi:hypothetical protein
MRRGNSGGFLTETLPISGGKLYGADEDAIVECGADPILAECDTSPERLDKLGTEGRAVPNPRHSLVERKVASDQLKARRLETICLLETFARGYGSTPIQENGRGRRQGQFPPGNDLARAGLWFDSEAEREK